MTGSIKVFYRVYPTEETDLENVVIDKQSNKVLVRRLQELAKNYTGSKKNFWHFQTDGVFLEARQDHIFEKIALDLLNDVMQGKTAVITAFGQTGSGKTFTVGGLNFAEKDFGLVPRIASAVFEMKREQPRNMKVCIEMSYIEFERSNAVDLLDDHAITHRKPFSKVEVKNEYQALKCIFLGEGRKRFNNAESGYASNLYSTVVTFYVTRRDTDLTNPTKVVSKLHVLDLVGNAYAKSSATHKEAKTIGQANVIKSELEQFVLCLTENMPERIKVKQRTNVLLHYLDGDLSNRHSLVFIGHITRLRADLLVTLSSLRFGAIVKGLKPKISENPYYMNEELELEYLKKELKACQREKYLDSVLLNQNLVFGLSSERIEHVDRTVCDYLNNHLDEMKMLNVADAKMVLERMKYTYKSREESIERLQAENQQLMVKSESSSLKIKSSKSCTNSSTSKNGKKSKESMSLKERRSSSGTLEKKVKIPASTEFHVSTEVSLTHKANKRKSTVENATKRSGRKRSISNTSVDRKDSRASIKSSSSYNPPLPDLVTDNMELWKQFTTSVSYKNTVEEYKFNEKELRSQFKIYLAEVDRLNKLKDTLDKCSRDLVVAQTFRKFNSKDELDENGNLVISFSEKSCQDQLESTRAQLLDQQEQTLKSQEEFKIFFDNRQSLVKKLHADFDAYCAEHNNMPCSNVALVENDLQLFSMNADIDAEKLGRTDEELVTEVPHLNERIKMIKSLQELMLNEMKRRQYAKEKSKIQWKNK
ncbi:kinesin-like protein KIF9 isoform X2 [Sitophilus oryzae]|uniref:Kinesin-like protein KIF9 isoform X2 n=1 Tax=Sitophilus oryzae TaxID=7048 RepID=A0A6J2XSP7_SITOR|nr:kinesin-like protein KIF9 isoform X2 [Sitophilus oryzae]